MHPLKKMALLRRTGAHCGIYSACSANELVIEAVLLRSRAEGVDALIEATANQVNQDGGYTGMTPVDFRDFVWGIADRVGFPKEKIILGGDHLGPLTWKNLPSEDAMIRARELVRQYVAAGFTKIHLDTSMYLADDDTGKRLPIETVARRGADLALVAERMFAEYRNRHPQAFHPVYVVGSEVPIPGGTRESDEGLQITSASDFIETYAIYERVFVERGLSEAWDSVIAFVVQPGVEFGDDSVHRYNSSAAAALTDSLHSYPRIVFEGHSTDYQTPLALRDMVHDGIAILKVGPALTFTLREGLIALEAIEKELVADEACRSRFSEILDRVMLANPRFWEAYYSGDDAAQRLARRYSFSDRCRYYLPEPEVSMAMERLLDNLTEFRIPTALVSQYLPLQARRIMEGTLPSAPRALLLDHVGDCIDDYLFATKHRSEEMIDA